MCGTVMRGADALPGSKATSRAKGSHRNLGGLGSGHRCRVGTEYDGPHREGEEPKPMMHGHEKSDLVIVAVKPTNKARKAPLRRRLQGRSQRSRWINITGGAAQTAVLSAKRLEILKEVVPRLSREAVLWNGANPALAFAWSETRRAAHTLGVMLQPHEMRDPKDFEAAFAMMAQQRPDALLVLQDTLTSQHRREIIDFTIQKRLPGIFVAKEWVEAGGLMSYGESLPDMYRRAAYFVDKILKGAKPADLPVDNRSN